MHCLFVLPFWFVIVNGLFTNETSHLEPRIHKGYSVGIHQYSFAVFLHFQSTRPSSCGGSLIMVQAVLTAAHCVDEMRYGRGQINAFFGATVPIDAYVVRRVVDYTIHPKYNEVNGKSNMAVVFLESRVPLKHEIKKVPLAAADPVVGVEVMSVGWGKQTFGKLTDYSEYRSLKATKQAIISRKDCENFSGWTVSPKLLCTKALVGHFYKDDSGNGLILTKPSHILVGVLSHVADGVGIYTNVYAERDWIITTCYNLYKKNCGSYKKNMV